MLSSEIRNIRPGYLLVPLVFSAVFRILTAAARQEEERKIIQIGKEEIILSLFADDMSFYMENIKESIKQTNKQTTPKTKKRVQQTCKIEDRHTKINCIAIY